MYIKRNTTIALTGLLAASVATAGIVYRADINSLNGSGVNGLAEARLEGDMLWIGVYLSDLEAGQAHAQHIHGRFDSTGNPIDSFVPTIANDTDGDGFIEVLEGVSSYGDVILPLSSPPPINNDASTISFREPGIDQTFIYEQWFDLSLEGTYFSPVTGNSYVGSDLLDLDDRVIVIHGMSVDGSPGAGTPGEINGTNGYIGSLPVAAGDFVLAPIPEPSTALSLITVGALGFMMIRRRNRKS
jgi:hypothetical protein